LAHSIWIQERDKKILKAAFEHKVLDLESVYQIAFEGLHIEIARRRALKLCAHGYLKRIPFLRGGHHFSLFSPTEKGIEEIRNMYPGELQIKVLKSYCVEHDLTLFKIRQRLEKLAMTKQYLTENMLQSLIEVKNSSQFSEFAKLNSDAAVVIKTNEGELNIAVEFENSEQAKGRYTSKFRNYYVRSEIHFVIYVCSRPQLMKNMGEIDRSLRGEGNHKIFFCLLDEVLKPSESLVFENLSKARIVLK
jgi:hypothetical protein